MSKPPHSPGPERVPPPPRTYRIMMGIMAPLEWALRFNCRHFIRLASERCDRSLGPAEKLVFHAHRWMCSVCRRQEQRLEHLRALVTSSTHAGATDTTLHLDDEARRQLHGRLQQELPGGTNNNTPPA